MEARELAALLAREADAGIGAALSALEAPGVLVPETVTGRVSAVPDGGADDLDEVTWQAEVTFRVGEVARTGTPPAPERGPARLAALPVSALTGAGTARTDLLASHGHETVGDLATAAPDRVAALVAAAGATAAVLVARARLAVRPWPTLGPEAAGWGSVLDVARTDPALLPGPDRVLAHEVWALCLDLVSALDAGVLAGVAVAEMGAR